MRCFRCTSKVSSFDKNEPTKPKNAYCTGCGLKFLVCIFEIRAIHIRDFAKKKKLNIDTPQSFNKARDLMTENRPIDNFLISEVLCQKLIKAG